MKALRFFLILLFSPFLLLAQEDKNPVETYFEVSLEELLNVGIVSATQNKQNLLDAPATAFVITAEQIELRGYSSLVDVLEDIPEIEIQRNSNNEQKNIITIRGVTGNEKLVILRNGLRISPALGETYTLGSQFNIQQAERIEVILGPASALYGADAFSGIVNIVYPETSTEKTDVSLSTSYGSYGTTNNSVFIGHKIEKLYITANGHFSQGGTIDLPSVYEDDFSWYNNKFQNQGLVYESPFFLNIYNIDYFERNAGASFHGPAISREFYNGYNSYSFNVGVHHDKFQIGYSRMYEKHSSATGLDPRFAIYDENAFVETVQNNITGKYKYTSFNEKWNMITSFNINFYEVSPTSNWITSTSRYQRGYYYSFTQSSNVDQKFQYSLNDKNSLIIGLSAEYASALPKTSLSPEPFDKSSPPVLQDFYYIGAAGYDPYAGANSTIQFEDSLAVNQEIFQVNYINTGLYGQYQFSPFPTLQTILGLRYDYNSRYGSTFNPRLGLVFEPIFGLKWKLLYGEAYLSPSPSKAFSQYGAFYGTESDASELKADFFHVANPNLKPEKLRTIESSINFFITRDLSVNVDGYYTQIDNLINQFAATNDSSLAQNISATKLETSINEGNSSIYGGTFSLKYLINGEKVTWNIYSAYSYVDGEINSRDLTYAAQNTVKFGIDIQHVKERFGASIRGHYRSPTKSERTIGGTDIVLQNDAYIIGNLNVYFKPVKSIDMKTFVTVQNFTNQKYYNAYYGNEEGFYKTPQNPITILGGISYEF